MRKPPALRPGDRVALLAPAGACAGPERLEASVRAVEDLGFEVEVLPSCRAREGYLAGSDDLRTADLHRAFADPALRGIFCLKGGYGSPRLLDRLDYRLIAASPKPFLGYSDLTALHTVFNRMACFTTIHGPMPSSDLVPGVDAFTRQSLLAALTSTEPLGLLPLPPGATPPEPLRPGRARGRLTGGNLSLVAATLGTPYAIDPEGAILFLEDVGEEPYRLDRLLTQLRLAGCFEACAGLVFGGFTRCEAKDPGRSLDLVSVLASALGTARVPAILGFPAGHLSPTLSLPFGVEAELDADAGVLTILESALDAPERST